MLDSILDLVKEAASLPRETWAPLLGLLCSWSLTQRLKFLLPARWSPKAREVSTQGLAFVIGTAITALVWGYSQPLAWIVGFIVGLIAPALWNVGMLLLGWWKPALATVLSQNTRPKA